MRPRRVYRAVSALSLGFLLTVAIGGCGDASSGGGSATGAKPAANPVKPAPPPAPVGTASAPPAASAPVPGGPRIEFPSLTYDFGVITDSQSYRTKFAFRNIGDDVLRIDDVKAACGCTVPVLTKRSYAPGEGGEIEVIFDPKGKANRTNKKLTVISNSVTNPTTELEFTSMIQPLLSIERIEQLGSIPLGTDFRHVVQARYRDPDLKIKSVSVNDENITATVLNQGEIDSTTADGVIYRADIEVMVSRNMPWGLLFAKRLTINVNGRWRPEAEPVDFSYDAFLMGSVFGEIRAEPGIISVGPLSPGSSFSKSIRLYRADGTPFRIVEAQVLESTMPGITVTVTPVGTAAYNLTLEGDVGSHRGPIRGVVNVRTEIPDEDNLRIQFSGQVR